MSIKQELKDIAVNLAYQAPASLIAWWQQLSLTTAIAIVLGLLQIAYLIRKWIREETEWGQRLKRWADGKFTKPGELR
jgi:mannose/fructose/N-acetylgalactosamine-specific phosphotransferase system component IID